MRGRSVHPVEGRSGREVGIGGSYRFAPSLGLLPFLLPPQGGEIEEIVGPARRLESSSVLGVGVEHSVVHPEKAAEARHVVGLIRRFHALMTQGCVLVERA